MRAELTGEIEEIGETQTIGTKGFQKRDFVVAESDTKFPNPVKFSLKKDNCVLLDGFKVGQKVKVTFSIDGRKWENPKQNNKVSWFIDLTAFKVQALDGSGAQDTPPPAEPPEDLGVDVAADDIPF